MDRPALWDLLLASFINNITNKSTMSKGWDYRDVSLLLQKLRAILLGREHNLHGRFPPLMSPRTIPTPDLPRGPDDNYSKKYYWQRNSIDSVKPPVVAPVAEGSPSDPKKRFPAETLCFTAVPTPGTPFWWDGHCYYECVADPPSPAPPCSPCPPKPCPPPPPCPPSKEDLCKKVVAPEKK